MIEVWKNCVSFVSVQLDGIMSVIKWADLAVNDIDSMNNVRLFLSKVALVCWAIWKAMNAFVFF